MEIKWLSEGTLTSLMAAQRGEARALGDGTWLPLVFEREWIDPPEDEPSYPHRPEAVQRSRELNKTTYASLLNR